MISSLYTIIVLYQRKKEEVMAWRLSRGDIAGLRILFSVGIFYGLISVLVYSIIHMKFITPLGMEAPLDRFSEGRAVEHVRVLSKDIGGRQVYCICTVQP